MIFGSNVAPKRRVIAKKYVPWTCDCFGDLNPKTNSHIVYVDHKLNPGYLVRCIDCGAERDK